MHQPTLAHNMAIRFNLQFLGDRMTFEEIEAAIRADCIEEFGCTLEAATEISQLAMKEMNEKLTFQSLLEKVDLHLRRKALA